MFILLLPTLCFYLVRTARAQTGYIKLCPLGGSPIVQLEYDPESHQFSVVDYLNGGSEGNRLLKDDESVQLGKHVSSGFFRGSSHRRHTETKTLYTARTCPCDTGGGTYCIIDSDVSSSTPDTCGIPQERRASIFGHDSNLTWNTTTIECFEMASQAIFIRNAWPVIVLWYGALIIFFIATSNGRNAQLCLLNKFCPCLQINQRYVDRIIRAEEDRQGRWVRLQSHAMQMPNRRLRRARGVRVRRSLGNDQEMTLDEQREEAMVRWIEAIDAFGLLSAREVSPTSQQPMEYALRTRKFDAQRERKRRKISEPNSNENVTGSNVTTPIKSGNKFNEEGQEGPTTPDTVGTNGSEGRQFSFNESADEHFTDEEVGISTQIMKETPDELEVEMFDCTICLSEISDGEEVGVLSCQHLFHVDCLKEWMLRRNACPLCQTEICCPRPVQSSSDDSSIDADADAVAPARHRSLEETPHIIDVSGIRRNTAAENLRRININRPYLLTTSFPDLTDLREPREPRIRSMSGAMTSPPSPSRTSASSFRIEGPFSFGSY
eukprot:scaffold291577_cov73-Cyclotella_meneghiniana.AAC.2